MKSDVNTVNCLPILIQKEMQQREWLRQLTNFIVIMSLSFLQACVSLISILISVNSSTCSYSRVEDVCSWALTETSDWRKHKKETQNNTFVQNQVKVAAWAEQQRQQKRRSQSDTCNSSFLVAKNRICICGLRGFKKHYREKLLKRYLYIVIYAYIYL